MGKKREQRKIEKVSEEVRKQYESINALTLGQQDLLPQQPPAEQTAKSAKQEEVPLAKPKSNRIVNILFVTLLLFLMVVLATTVLQRYYVGSIIVVSGTSMTPTYTNGEEVWVDKTRSPKRGDVVVLYANDVSNKFVAEFAFGQSTGRGGKYEKLIKRVVAVAGDKLWIEQKDGDYVLVIETPEGEIREDYYTRNGQPVVFLDSNGQLDENNPVYVPYLGGRSKLGCLSTATKQNPFVVREGRFFYLGDNRIVSADSRSERDVPWERLIGVVVES